MSLFLAIYTMAQIQKLMYDHKLNTLRRPPSRDVLKAGEFMLDGPHLMVGLITVFRQFHPQSFKRYIWYITHYYKQIVNANQGRELPGDAGMILAFLDELMKFDG